jgi:hypothetical protein
MSCSLACGSTASRPNRVCVLHIDTGKYMRVTELFSFSREELLKDSKSTARGPDGVRHVKSPSKKGKNQA